MRKNGKIVDAAGNEIYVGARVRIISRSSRHRGSSGRVEDVAVEASGPVALVRSRIGTRHGGWSEWFAAAELLVMVRLDVRKCARCGGDHAKLHFEPLLNRGTLPQYFATCPATGQPILMRPAW